MPSPLLRLTCFAVQFGYLAGKAAPHEFNQLVIYKTLTFSDEIKQIDSCRAYHSGEVRGSPRKHSSVTHCSPRNSSSKLTQVSPILLIERRGLIPKEDRYAQGDASLEIA